ncbi:MAG: GTP cyclohydrolase II [Pseudomonadota bacterium]
MKSGEPHSPTRAVLRAIGDLRRGVPVAVTDNGDALLVLSVETASEAALAELAAVKAEQPFLLLSAQRAGALKVPGVGQGAVALAWPAWLGLADVIAVADPRLDLARPLKGPFAPRPLPRGACAEAALELAKQAQLLPALIALAVSQEALAAADVIRLPAADILNFATGQAETLRPVVDARVPLAGAEDARVHAFRPGDGGIEHLAIVIGDPPRRDPVLTRLHSECLTGDLLGSLKCDCGDQLKGAIAAIATAGGGVVLYLAQEGRGIGLMNKLRAYNLQGQGFDTVDANLKLGFAVDERLFAPAATMLRQLGFSAVRLMTNNPAKVAALGQHGIRVVERVPHRFPANPHNEAYLAAKRDRTGHLF